MIMKDLKVVFMGTPDFSVNVLNSLIEHTNVIGVVTQPDKLVGRKQVLTPPIIIAKTMIIKKTRVYISIYSGLKSF